MEKKSWILPILAGLISLISLLFPAAYVEIVFFISVKSYIWMCGYVQTEIGANKTARFSSNPLVIYPSLISTVVVVVSSVLLLLSANQVRSGQSKEKTWLYSGIFLLFAVIFWAVMMVNFNANFWDVYNVGFGLIGPIIGGILALLSYILKDKF